MAAVVYQLCLELEDILYVFLRDMRIKVCPKEASALLPSVIQGSSVWHVALCRAAKDFLCSLPVSSMLTAPDYGDVSSYFDPALWPCWLTNPHMRHNYQLSPATRLPPRTLEQIFLYACDSYIVESQMPSMWAHRARSVMMAPLFLTQVCIRWRNIANTTPRLWRNLAVCLTPETLPYAGELVDEFCRKSGPFTINICFFVTNELVKYSAADAERGPLQGHECCPHPFREGVGFPWDRDKKQCWPDRDRHTAFNEHSMKAILAAVRHSDKWERAHFAGNIINYDKFLVHVPRPLNLPKLVGLEIRHGLDITFDTEIFLFEYAYALRNLKISETLFEGFIFAWSLLQQLYVTKTQDTEILRILAQCPYLDKLFLDDPWTDPDFPITHPVALHHLRKFSLSVLDSSAGQGPLHILDSVTVPSILDIKLANFNLLDSPARPLWHLQRLLGRSHARDKLQCLDLTNVNMVEQELVNLLQLTTSLVALHIQVHPTDSGSVSTKNLLANLSDTTARPAFLPNLRILICFGMTFAVKNLLLMLRRRSGLSAGSDGVIMVQPLRGVHIHMPTCLRLSVSLQNVVDALRANGLDLRLNEEGERHCGCTRP